MVLALPPLASQLIENLPAGMDLADALADAMHAEAQVELAKRSKP